MNFGANTNLPRERKDAGEKVQPQDHKSEFRPTAEGAKGGEKMRLFLNKKEVLVIKRILESYIPKDIQEREVTQALLRRIAKCQAMQGTKRQPPQ